MRQSPHRHPVRVYYEDTDLAGIVYYANYLKYLERGRSELVRAAGISQTWMQDEGLVFAVRRVEADYLRPARFEDDLIVETNVAEMRGARVVLAQRVLRGDAILLDAAVTIVVLTTDGRAARLPAELRAKLAGWMADTGEDG